MKIIFCLNHFLPQQVAGTEIYTFSLIKEMQQKGITCLVLIPNYDKEVNAVYSYDGIKVIRYAEPSVVDRSLKMGKRPAEGLQAFSRVLKEEQPDIVHFQELAGSSGLSLYHVKAAKATGAKIVMTFHLAGYSCRTGDLMYKSKELCDGVIDEKRCSLCFIHKKGYEKYSAPLWAISEQLYKWNWDSSEVRNKLGTALSIPFLIKKLRKNLEEISEVCDQLVILTNWYHKVLKANGIPEKKMKVILQGLPLKDTFAGSQSVFTAYPLRLMFIGRISHFKGVHLLVAACRLIDPLKLSIHIYGSSMDTGYEMQCKIDSVSMPNLKWMGQLEQSQVIPTMQQYHALCLPSTFSEMSPLVIQEAFAAGIPVIASNIYGNAEQVHHEVNGLLFEFNNATDLAAQIQRLVDNPEMLAQLQQRVTPSRSFKQVGDEYWELYNELILPSGEYKNW